MKRLLTIAIVGAALAGVALASPAGALAAKRSQSPGYQNPVFASPGAPDPMVLDVAGTHSNYYAFSTGDRFPMLRSKDLVSWAPAGAALAVRPSWAVQEGEWNPWSPSVIERAGPCPGSTGTRCFVLFFVSRHGTLSPATNCIGVATSPTPGGPYQDRGPLKDTAGSVDGSGRPIGCGDDVGYSNIDPAPFVDADGKAYLYLSTTRRCLADGTCPGNRRIGVIPLGPGLLTATGPRQELFGATDPWEQASFGGVVENPWLHRRGDSSYFLLFSGGAYNGPYGMGYATSATPTGPFVKDPLNPFLREANNVLSVGGGMLVTGPRGGTWLAYHGRQDAYTNPRQLRIDSVSWPSATTLATKGPTSARQSIAP
ncbi:MAG: family 43 glycosylhydrolase [Thermoleophilaceae bacterium]